MLACWMLVSICTGKVCACAFLLPCFLFNLLYICTHTYTWTFHCVHVENENENEKKKKKEKYSREEKASMMKDTKGNNTISNLAKSQREKKVTLKMIKL